MMLVNTCNRCKQPTSQNICFKFDIKGYTPCGIFVHDISDLDSPEIKLNDFCLCENCMKDFLEFVKEGKKQ